MINTFGLQMFLGDNKCYSFFKLLLWIDFWKIKVDIFFKVFFFWELCFFFSSLYFSKWKNESNMFSCFFFNFFSREKIFFKNYNKMYYKFISIFGPHDKPIGSARHDKPIGSARFSSPWAVPEWLEIWGASLSVFKL